MRNIINISLPSSMARNVRDEVKSGGFASISEYIRHIIRSYREDHLFKEVQKSMKEFDGGKGKILSSLKDIR